MDQLVDVLVVGAGPGGMASALASATADARTVLVEATDRIGGNAVLSTGYLAILDSDEQHAAGIEDDEERFLEDLQAAAAEESREHPALLDEELARRFVRGTRETYELLRDLGVGFDRFVRRPRQHTADRMLAVTDTTVFRTGFEARLAEAGVEVWTSTRAVELAADRGRWRVHLVHDGTDRWVRATAVVLATGGYQGNAELRRRHQPASMADSPHLGLSTCRGDGHVMAAAVGADMLNMGLIPSLVIVASGLVEDAIAVNRDGVRFHDETGPYEQRVAAVRAQPHEQAHYVYDDTTAARRRQLIEQMPRPPVTAPSLRDLAERIGVPADALEQTVASWTRVVEGTVEDPFGRGIFPHPRRGITTPPYHAVPLVVGAQFTGGGCRVTDEMAVVDLWGRPVTGLHAVGDCIGGVNAGAAVGGIHIVSALTLGRVAGTAAAAGRTGRPTSLAAPGAFGGTARSAHATIDIVPVHDA